MLTFPGVVVVLLINTASPCVQDITLYIALCFGAHRGARGGQFGGGLVWRSVL